MTKERKEATGIVIRSTIKNQQIRKTLHSITTRKKLSVFLIMAMKNMTMQTCSN